MIHYIILNTMERKRFITNEDKVKILLMTNVKSFGRISEILSIPRSTISSFV